MIFYNYARVPICNKFEKWEAQFWEISGFPSHKKIKIYNVWAYSLPRETNNNGYAFFIKGIICLLNSFEHLNCKF